PEAALKCNLWTAEEFQKMVQGGKLVMRITYVADSPAFWNSSYGPKGTSRVWTLDGLWGTVGADTTVCCFSYTSRKLPQSHVKDYFYTSSKCSQPAVVFITRKDREVCANPDARWVKEYVNALELQ
ncbi:C-C motif chemokine 5, partial [Columba livia]